MLSLKTSASGGGSGDGASIGMFAAGVGVGAAVVWLYRSLRHASHPSLNALPFEPLALVRKKTFSTTPPEALVPLEANEAAKQ